MPGQTDTPIMQDLSDPKSFIAQAFARMTRPVNPFEPNGDWTHVYDDLSSYSLEHHQGRLSLEQFQGRLTLTHESSGRLRIENYRECPDGYHSYTLADLSCQRDGLRSPVEWRVESKVAKQPGDGAHLNSGLVKQATVNDNVLTLKTGDSTREVNLPGAYTCKWCLLDVVGWMELQGTTEVGFTLLDEYDELCPNQLVKRCGQVKAKTRGSTIDVACYQHTGIGTMPGVFYVDSGGRVLFYLADMQLLALATANGIDTGFLK